MKEIKFRGETMGGHYVYGLLTRKKIRSSGELAWAIATGECKASETIPVLPDSIAQLVGRDADGKEVYEGDLIIYDNGELKVASMIDCYTVKFATLKEEAT